MKLKDEYIKLPKDMVYDIYETIVYDTKDYDNITRGKMLDEVIKQYSLEKFLFNICTEKELLFLKYARNKKVNAKDIEKYEWEINILNRKCIFSMVTYEIFEDQKKNVDNALELYEKQGVNADLEKMLIFIISQVKINATLLIKALFTLLKSLCNINEEKCNQILGNPLIHFYCCYYDKYMEFSHKKEEFIFYRDYEYLLDEVEDSRKEYGMSGSKGFDIRDNLDIFYYGFPIRNEKVKKMYDLVKKESDRNFLLMILEDARVTNQRDALPYFINNEELLKVVNEALDEMPCAVMNGFTPKEYDKEIELSANLDKYFEKVPQNDAHLPKKGADEYYKLYFGLLDYTNKKYKLDDEIGRIYKQEGLDVQRMMKIDKYFWEHKEIIDDFIKINPYNFSSDELEIIEGFKTAVTSDMFVIVGFERSYTKILSEDGKLYMVKGIRANFDEIINPDDLPAIVSTTLLMFKNNIIFKSFFNELEISFGNAVKRDILEKEKKAIKYYHL